MEPTVFGALVAFGGIALLWRPPVETLVLVLLCTLLGGASAFDLPSLGGASIPPAEFALLFLFLRVAIAHTTNFSSISASIRQNVFLVGFALYGAATAFILPRIFAHTMNVVALRVQAKHIYSTSPLAFGSQNVTTAVYLLGTMMAALLASLAVRTERAQKTLVGTAVAVGALHVCFGMADLVLSRLGLGGALDVFRNASYAQLNQDISGIHRIAGIFPETSSYAAFGFVFLVANTELWIRSRIPLLTGATALALLLILLLTTSSTAYFCIAVYGFALAGRAIAMRLPLRKVAYLAFVPLAGLALVLAFAVFFHPVTDLIRTVVERMTIEKAHSLSGMQRAFWAKQGWDAFFKSFGVGIGAGSFRSSGLIPAVLGASGVLGLALLASHLFALARSSPLQSADREKATSNDVARCFAWAALASLVPALIDASSSDPGLLFGLLSGAALSTTKMSARRARDPMNFNVAIAPSRPLTALVDPGSRPRRTLQLSGGA